MSTIKADGIQASTGTNTDLTLAGKGTGVPDLAAGFKVGSVAGVPTASIRDDAVTLAKMAGGTDGVILTYDASGNPVHVGPGSDGEVLTSTGAGSPPAFEAAGGGGLTLDSVIATTTGNNTVGISTSIPAGTKLIYVNFDKVQSGAGYQHYNIQIGDSGGFEITGYVGCADHGPMSNYTQWDIGILTFIPQVLTETVSGVVTITLQDAATNTWSASSVIASTPAASDRLCISAGTKALSGELTSIRLFATSGSWDSGSISISYI